MRVLLIGVGGVGEAIAKLAQNRPWLEHMVLADYNLERAKAVQARLDTGVKDGKQREVYIYQVTDNLESMKNYGCQAVSLQTATGPVITMELLAEGTWKGKGVHGPEAFDPRPFLAKMMEYKFPYKIQEEESQYSQSMN